ncbi:MAG: hypothetical protein GXY32_01675 [Ruminococcaceae bacterium]|nr:hypothetical protein [Oscillospiraceae bacterium]
MALTQEDLQAIGALMAAKLEPLQTDIAALKQGQSAMQKDITHIKRQVDVVYDWVDGIDLRVKTLERG